LLLSPWSSPPPPPSAAAAAGGGSSRLESVTELNIKGYYLNWSKIQ
jgi:hypothetical protein